MSKNVLQFSEDGTDFHFIFANGGESVSYGSKEAGYKVIADLANNKKITIREFGEMRNQILLAENLPWGETVKRPFSGSIGLLLALSSMSIISDIMESVDIAELEPVDVATFKLCNCGKLHGRIFLKNGGTSLAENKQQALSLLDAIKKVGHVTDEEFEKVKMEIENSGMS